MSSFVLVAIPYNMTQDDIQIDESARNATADEQMDWFNDNVSWSDEEEMELIFRSVTLLKAKNPSATMGECLETAFIWSRG